MGCGAAVPVVYARIGDRYKDPDQVFASIQRAGLTESQLIIGIDFTRSNLDTGEHSFEGRSLHDVSQKKDQNPYQQAFSMVSASLAEFDADQLFPVYGFGDAQSGSGFVFSFMPYDKPCHGMKAAEERYKQIASCVSLGGPTSLSPIIRQAIRKVREAATFSKPVFHILIVLMDGQVSQTDKLETEMAIQEASLYPMSIVCIGLGDGPWHTMVKYDDKLRRRCFDNFQFMEFNTVFGKYPYIKRVEAFATHALQEIPSQVRACNALGYLKKDWEMPKKYKVPPKVLGPPDQPNVGDPSYGIVEGWTAVYSEKTQTFFYMSTERPGEAIWDKPVVSLYKPPKPGQIEDDDDDIFRHLTAKEKAKAKEVIQKFKDAVYGLDKDKEIFG